MLFRIFVVAALVIAAMLVVKDGRVLRDAGLTGSCAAVAPPSGQTGVWKACKAGKLDGRPDLSRQGCTPRGIAGRIEYWRCPATISSSFGT